MSIHPRSHLPVSARHAFALAFDIATRRDLVQSLIVPLVVRAPWIVIPAVLDPLSHSNASPLVYGIASLALLVDFFLLLLTCGMMRYRARSVFNTPESAHPAPVLECYARSLGRLPWLFVTEMVRSLSLVFATFFLVLPGVFLGFRLSCATEAVVLDEPHLAGAFQRSSRLTAGRFERWFEMATLSGFIALSVIFVMTVVALVFPGPGFAVWFAVMQVIMVLVTTVIQYAWTFFYLRLVEIEAPGVEVGPLYAGGSGEPPRLKLVEPQLVESHESSQV
jgi:hypothetical protein